MRDCLVPYMKPTKNWVRYKKGGSWQHEIWSEYIYLGISFFQ